MFYPNPSKRKKFRIIFLCLFLSSCSHSEKDLENPHIIGVDIDQGRLSSVKPNIDESQTGESYGPAPLDSQEFSTGVNKRKAVIGLMFTPGLARVFGSLSFSTALLSKKGDVQVYTGIGMGAVLAALMAKGLSPSQVEWSLRKFFKLTILRKKRFFLK